MANSDPLDMIEEIRTWVDEEFLHTPNKNKCWKLASLATKLSSLAMYIKNTLPNQNTSGKPRKPHTRLKVKFSNGTIIRENTAADTLVKVIQRIGPQQVSELPIKMSGRPLVSTQRPESVVKQVRELDGYFIETRSNTKTKAKCIEQIADALHIDISVSVID